MAAKDLAVPVARLQNPTAGALRRASEVQRADGPFYCVRCFEQLSLKRGSQRVAHFSHRPECFCRPDADDDGASGGGGESFQHATAKRLVAEALHRCTFDARCPQCRRSVRSTAFADVARFRAEVEFVHRPFRLDVGVIAIEHGRPCAAIEVFHRHRVQDEKRAALERDGISVIEVRADRVLTAFETNERQPRISYDLPSACDACRKEAERASWKRKRPCLVCEKWLEQTQVTPVTPPVGHSYRSAYLCSECMPRFRLCCTCLRSSISSTPLVGNRNERCGECVAYDARWICAATAACDAGAYGDMGRLLAARPDWCDDSRIRQRYAHWTTKWQTCCRLLIARHRAKLRRRQMLELLKRLLETERRRAAEDTALRKRLAEAAKVAIETCATAAPPSTKTQFVAPLFRGQNCPPPKLCDNSTWFVPSVAPASIDSAAGKGKRKRGCLSKNESFLKRNESNIACFKAGVCKEQQRTLREFFGTKK